MTGDEHDKNVAILGFMLASTVERFLKRRAIRKALDMLFFDDDAYQDLVAHSAAMNEARKARLDKRLGLHETEG